MNIPNRFTHEIIWDGTLEDFKNAIAHRLIILSGANLSGVDLSDANLQDVNFNCANLSNANLSNADLSRAHLSSVNLRGANLSGVDLLYADLSCADLSNANMSGADLNNVDLSNANLSGADLSNANLSGADLRYAHLDGRPISAVMGIGPIGSRGDNLTIWLMRDGTRLYSTGCQKQITEELFLDRNAIRMDDEKAYTNQYLAAIEFARIMSKNLEDSGKKGTETTETKSIS